MRIKQFKARSPRRKPHLRQRRKLDFSAMPRWKRRLARVGIACGAFFLFLVAYTIFVLPSVSDASELIFAESTIIYDRKALDPNEDPADHILYTIYGDENREFVPLEEMSPWVPKATVAIEDDQFYSWWHIGFDPPAIIKAALNYFFGIGDSRGGSTITQQLVKNSFLTNEKSLTRKFNEMLLSIKMEMVYSKDEILELYLNKIPYGHNAHGIEAAAKKFLGKSARDLTLAEAAVLASLPARPTYFSPYGSHRDALMGYYKYADGVDIEEGAEVNHDDPAGPTVYKKGRKDLVLQRMLEEEMVTFEEFKNAWSQSKDLTFQQNRTDIKAPHFVFYVRQQLEDKYGKEFLKNGGLRIYTTLDPDLQELAEDVIETKTAHYAGTYGAQNVAMVSISPQDGEILAYVGGKDYFDTTNDGQVDVLTSRRQPGSSFKPLTYATAFEKGYAPSTIIFDVETDFGGNYKPQNFDGKFAGPVSAREAINRSLNIPAVKMAYLATPENILENAKKVGIQTESKPIDVGISIGIGAAEVEPLSHINSFQVFARDGSWYEPTSILEIHNSEGKVLEKFNPERTYHKGLDPQISALVRNILTDETTRPTTDGFDWNTFLQIEGIDNGAKTGTSNRMVANPDFDPNRPEDPEKNPKEIYAPGDSWTIGFSPFLVTGVWVGNNRGQPMKPGATGLTVAAPVWKRFMEDSHAKIKEDLGEEEFEKENVYPEVELETVKINKWNGKIATDKTPPKLAVEEVFASFARPIELDEPVSTTRTTGRFGTYSRPATGKISLSSLLPEKENWNEPVQEWLRLHPQYIMSSGSEMDPEDRLPNYAGMDPTWRGNREDLRFQLFNRNRRDTRTTTTQQNTSGSISILSPKDGGNIASGTVTVRAHVTNPQDIQEVEFYFDDYLVTYANSYPWEKRLRIPTSLAVGSEHTIKVVAVDNDFNSQEAEVSVKISHDRTGPEIVFLGPVAQQRIPQNTLVNVLADVQDYQSEVKIVEFLLDEDSLGYSEQAPYTTQFTPTVIGRHNLTVRAWDVHENVSEKTIPFSVDREASLRMADPEITNIKDYRASVSVDVVVPAAENFEWIQLSTETGDYVDRIDSPTQQIQFQIPKLYSGQKENVYLEGKKKGEESQQFGSKLIER